MFTFLRLPSGKKVRINEDCAYNVRDDIEVFTDTEHGHRCNPKVCNDGDGRGLGKRP